MASRGPGTAQVLDAPSVVTPGTRIRHVELDDGTVIVQDGAVVQGAGIPVTGLGANITATQYPEGGEGRITVVP
jgi:hypothetical protein